MKIILAKDVEGLKETKMPQTPYGYDQSDCAFKYSCRKLILEEVLSLAKEVDEIIPKKKTKTYLESCPQIYYQDGFNQCRQAILKALEE